MSTKALFSPVKVGNNTLKHRVVLSPLTRLRALPSAIPSDLQVEYYEQRSSEGGLLITESTFISRLAGGFPQAPGIYNKEQIKSWKKVASAVHEKNAVIFLQLWHAGRAGFKALNPNGEEAVSASAIAISGDTITGGLYEVHHTLEINEIKAIVQDYAQAAKNAIEAGFDGVEIHSAAGYLLDQFINTSNNKRTDIYGGSIENRARFPLKVVDAIAEAIGPERTTIRFSPGASFQDMKDDTVEQTWGYLTSQLQDNYPDLAYLHLIEGRTDFLNASQVNTIDTFEAYRKIWKGPLITAGGFSTSLEFADEISETTGNLISYGRAFLANPDLPEHLRNGWPLNQYDRNTFYTNESSGYTDYPFYRGKK